MAADFLTRRGATIIGRNLRAGRGEIDILARWGHTVVAVEVKTRRGGDPLLAFTPAKEQRVRAAMALVRPAPHRLDLVTVAVSASGVDIRWLPHI
ncbi:MAG: YraN family protein [Acidimicrobiia bacterium]|nr:YraN family protein [Acidimicrobiia bacterium]NNF10918.1 YraN family protein [Acidimicrobiia bacterium]NNL71645.1 YraN family protein [Acidimicrobiia bacterium]